MKASFSKIGDPLEFADELLRLETEIIKEQETCPHPKPMRWAVNWQGVQGNGNMCEVCAKVWFEPLKIGA